MRISSRKRSRRGLTLIEVLVSLAIFLMSIVALYRLIDLASDNAQEIVNQSRSTRLMESKLAEFVAGSEVLSGSTSGEFDEEPGWKWSAEMEQDAIPNLWKVTVTVSKDVQSGPTFSNKITQYILDPTYRGGLTADSATTTSSSSTTGTTTGGN